MMVRSGSARTAPRHCSPAPLPSSAAEQPPPPFPLPAVPRPTLVVCSAWSLSVMVTCWLLVGLKCTFLFHSQLDWGLICGTPPQKKTCPSLPTPPPHTQAHPGGVLSLEFERPGHLLATCGADKTVQTWDLNTNQHVTTFHVSTT